MTVALKEYKNTNKPVALLTLRYGKNIENIA